jgi:hypothetical protein
MTKIQLETAPPRKAPEPPKTPRPSSAPPFTPAPPKPRQPAASQTPHAMQAQRQQARNVKPSRPPGPSGQAAQNARAAGVQQAMREPATPDLGAGPNVSTRFDRDANLQRPEFFEDFTERADALTEGGTEASLDALAEVAALDESLDCAALARVLPPGDNDGIFDVILPSGEQLGVVVSGRASSLSYLLSPSTDKFSARLRRHKMELEERLEQLTHRNVNITVL